MGVFNILKRFILFTIITVLLLGFIVTVNPFHNNFLTYGLPLNNGAQEKIPVLCYHHVYDGNIKKSVFKDSNTVLPLSLFEKHMKYLHNNNFYTATLDELADFMEGKIDLPKRLWS